MNGSNAAGGGGIPEVCIPVSHFGFSCELLIYVNYSNSYFSIEIVSLPIKLLAE